MSLSRIDDESVWWSWIGEGEGDSVRLERSLMYQLTKRRIFVAKSFIRWERVWFLMGYRLSIFPIAMLNL